MAAFLSLIGGVKGLVVIALLLALGSWAAVQKINLNKAEAARDTAIAQRDEAAVARDKAIAAAKANEATITRLQQEKELTNQALNTLQAAKNTNKANTGARETIILSGAGLPANSAVAAPVLGAIVSEVQADRYSRRGITPPVIASAPAGKGIKQ